MFLKSYVSVDLISLFARISVASVVPGLLSFLAASPQTQAQSFDFGDAPDSYGTLLNSNGPRHTAFTALYLGGSLGSYYDAEPDGQPSTMADGDDTHDQNGRVVAGQNDEDGLVNGFPAVSLQKSTYTLRISVYNNSGSDATVSAWIDLNKNGVFDANERTQAVVSTTPNLTHYNGTPVTLIWKGIHGLTEGWTYARIRVASKAGEVANPTGPAASGEVEDYRVQLKDEYDFGDAPASYGTMLNDNGARHLINNNLILLGALDCSAEDDGKPSDLADGDDGETAVRFPYKLTTAKTQFQATVNVLNTSGANATLSGWVDFNRNGAFDANERAQAVVAPDARNLVLSWRGVSGLTAGRTYARFRVATSADDVANPTGFASSGAVEDYTLMIESPPYDYGDAPDSYGTRLSSNGPHHIYNDEETKLCLSNGVTTNDIDAEADGQPSAQAEGDNAVSGSFGTTFAFNDETGLISYSSLITNSTSWSATLSVKNQTGAPATVSGWLDANRNGTFEANERVQATVPADPSGGLVPVTVHWEGLSNLTAGQTFVRFRVASNPDELTKPTGVASDGEVEDYGLTITQAPMPVDLISFRGQWVERTGIQLSWATAWEQDNAYFDVQRSSDAKSFEAIGRVTGAGNSQTTQAYTFADEPGGQAALSYYRLKQVDTDGKITYSSIIAVRNESSPALLLTVYPNPASEQISLKVEPDEPISQIRIYNAAGVEVISQERASNRVPIRALPTGSYLVDVMTTTGQHVRQRFIKL